LLEDYVLEIFVHLNDDWFWLT